MRRPVSPPPTSSAAVNTALPVDRSVLRAAIATLWLCAAYYAAGLIGMALRFQPGQISGIWLPHGILVAALLAAPLRRWWLYAAALLPTHLHLVSTFQAPIPLVVILIQFGGNIAAAGLAAAPLRRVLGQPPRLDTLGRMGAFIAVAAILAPCAISAVVARLFLATGWVEDFWIAWQRRTFTGMCGAVIIAAPIVHLAAGGLAAIRRVSARQAAELASLTVVLVALLAVSGAASTHVHRQWWLFVPLPLLLWSAVRFGPGGLGLHLLAVALVAMLNTKANRGPFATGSTAEMVIGLQLFFMAISVPLMLLAALVRQHAQADVGLRQSRAQYRSIVEDQADLICRFLADGTYTFVNGAYGRYFQRSPEELIGQTIWQFIPDDEHPSAEAFLASITPDHPVASIEHPLIGAGGEVRWHQWTDRGFFDEHGRIIEYQAVGRDITERRRAEEALKDSENQVRLFVEHTPAAVAMFDREMRYLVYSRRWLTDYRLGDQDLVGRSHYHVFPEVPERWKEIHRRCLAGAVEVDENDSFVRGDGSTDWLRWEVRPWRNARSEIGGVIMFTEVITERKRAEEERRKLQAQARVAEALQELDRRKDEFLAMLAHELRNPLAPIALAAEVIRMCEPADESIVSAQEIITRQTAQLTRLVDDLLDISRITLGKINLNLAVVDLRRIIAQAVEATQPLLTAHNHALSIDVPDGPLPIRGDAARLTQIISNLLNNAAKYTHDGGAIALGARIVDGCAIVTVADNGLGIPAPMLERVFDLYTQLDGTGDRSQDGLGVGLALVKRLVEMHEGDIEAHSEGPGRGSEMVVRFPLAIEEQIPAAPPAGEGGGVAAPGPEVRQLRILVVDDNVDAAESLSGMLRLQRHEVLVAHDGLTALAAVPVMKPDVVLLDLGMPELNGLEVARRLREMDEGAQALLVAITGYGQAEDRARTAAVGFDCHLTKPVDLQVLYGLLQTGRARSQAMRLGTDVAASTKPGGERAGA
jgi:PAS domain S-box-containing protein